MEGSFHATEVNEKGAGSWDSIISGPSGVLRTQSLEQGFFKFNYLYLKNGENWAPLTSTK